DPNPNPNPGPTPTDVTVLDEQLGQNSFVLDNGSYADAFTFSAAQDGVIQLFAKSTTFVPQMEVLQFNADGSTQVITVDTNAAGGQTASVQINAQAGVSYEVVVASTDPNSYGYYQLGVPNSVANFQQLSPSWW